jgi:hypothetical protein
LAGRGSRQRKSPVGGWAKGTPRKILTPVLCCGPAPSTTPAETFTRSAAAALNVRAVMIVKRIAAVRSVLFI